VFPHPRDLEKFSERTGSFAMQIQTISLLVGVNIALAIAFPMTARAGATPAQRCEAGKHGAAAAYAGCLLKAQQKFVAGGRLDTAGREEAEAACVARYSSKWRSLESKAGPAVCPSEGDESDVQDFLEACVVSTEDALAGGSLPPDVVTCNSDLADCSATLTTRDADLLACNSGSSTCSSNLSTCTTQLTTCSGGTATDADVVSGKTYSSSAGIGRTGTAPVGANVSGADGSRTFPLPDGFYSGGRAATANDSDLVAGNIRAGTTIFGVTGSLDVSSFRNLSGMDLTGTNLSGMDLTVASANLTGAILISADLSEAELTGQDLSGRDLSNANFMGTDLTNVNFTDADLKNANFTGTDLTNVNLTNASLQNANLADANLAGTLLMGIWLNGTNLTGANFAGANLAGAALFDIDASGVDLSNTILTGTGIESANLRGADLTGADLSGAFVGYSDFSNADLSGANLRNTYIYSHNLYGPMLFTGANLTDVDFDGAFLFDVTWGNTTCPDRVNSDSAGGSCCGHMNGATLAWCSY
jgi:uncharacterized protein YjbI with pentapeptide repeats